MNIQNIDNKEIKRLYQSETGAAHSVGKAAGHGTVGKSASSLSGKDQATVSEGARLLAESLAALNNTPDVRADVVAKLKAQIEAGEYEIPYEDLAKQLTAIIKG